MLISRLFGSLRKESRIVMLGLDAAGKTTTLYKLQLGEVVHTVPTVGFNVEAVSYKNVDFTVWDVGGQKILRKLWRHYLSNTDALIFIVDSSDRERVSEAREELEWLLANDELRNARILVYANKQDLPRAMAATELAEQLDMRKMAGDRSWFVQPACATTGDGLVEGLDWLVGALKAGAKR